MMKHTLTVLSLCATLFGSIVASQAAPRDPAEQRASVITLLSAYEPKIDRAIFDKIGPDVNRILIRLSGDPRIGTTIRVRATASLAYFPSKSSQNYLKSLFFGKELVRTRTGVQIRRQALRSYARAFREKAVDHVLELEHDPNPLIREAVAHALGDTGSKPAQYVLRAWAQREPSLVVREAIDRSIGRLGRQ